ncbi:MAG: Ig-like domain-containing protein, partial [Pirellulaceae bacterium]
DQNGSGSYSQVIAGMDWVTARADDIEVANMSLGGGYSQSVNDALEGMTNAGIVVAVAAGNDGADAGNYSPASAESAITVSAAVDTDGKTGGLSPDSGYGPDDTLASFSNYGEVIDIAAPGVNIYSTVPGGYDTYSGTSMASPHVAGAAALEILARGTRELNGDYVKAIRDALVDAGQPMAEWRTDTLDTDSDPDNSNESMVYVGAEVDQPPTADDISATTNEDTAIEVTLSGSDAETVELTFQIISGPSSGTLSGITNQPGVSGEPNNDTALITYTPDDDYHGSDSFTYQVKDENGGTAQGVVSLTIKSINDAPVAVADSYSTTADTTLTVDAVNGVLANDSDVDGDTLTAVLGAGPTHGTLELAGDGSFTYTPNESSNEDDSFTYYATDGSLNSNTVTVAINMNNPPVADTGGPYSGTEDEAVSFDASGSKDLDGDTLTYLWDFGDGSTETSDSPTTAHVYKWGGNFDVTLTVSDGRGGTDTSATTADVVEVNDAPVADAGGPYSGIEEETITFDASGSTDYDNEDGTAANDQTLTYDWTFGDGGTATTQSPTTEYTYIASGDYNVSLTVSDGTDSHSVTASASIAEVLPELMHIGDLDGTATTEKNQWRAFVTITVLDANGDPLSDATVTGNWSGGYTGTVSATTDATGKATVASGWTHKKNESMTFSVADVIHESFDYQPSSNTDPDGDSDGTGITVFKDGTTAAP